MAALSLAPAGRWAHDRAVRIISGTARGRTIVAPSGQTTRPTGDRVREALFSALEARFTFHDITVLDLFAGSGALGLEALSRGARHATFVDEAASCAKVIERNLTTLGFRERARSLVADAVPALEGLAKRHCSFELVLLDPPYRLEAWPIGSELLKRQLVAEEGWVVFEHGREREAPEQIDSLVLDFHRCYGAAALSIYQRQ